MDKLNKDDIKLFFWQLNYMRAVDEIVKSGISGQSKEKPEEKPEEGSLKEAVGNLREAVEKLTSLL